MSEFPCWVYVDATGDIPQSRSGHTCALYKNRYLFVFGGFDGSACFDDLYCLDVDLGKWRKCDPGGDLPSGRASHSVVTDELSGSMYIFGGSGSHFGYTNKRDLYEFTFETQKWSLLCNPQEDTPSARYGQSMVQHKEGLYVWGGTHGTNYPTDMYRFDLCSKNWEFVVTMGELPSGRYRHQAMVKDDIMYVVGGSGINRYGDVFIFQFDASCWSRLITTGADLSDGRYAHSTVLRGQSIFLYGGNDGVRHDDLLQLDLITRVWSRVQVQGSTPPGRDFHAAVLRDDCSMLIFGGSSGMRRHNDTYDFRLTARVPPCTFSSDMGSLLERSQHELSWQAACDVLIYPKEEPPVYAHAHILVVRCPHILPQRERDAAARATSKDLDDMLRDVSDDQRAQRPRVIVRTECSSTILWHVMQYIYTEEVYFGSLSVENLFFLYLHSQALACTRLAALCERQLKLRINPNNIMEMLKLAERHQCPGVQPVMEACKYFFLVNYNLCAELEECERLEPKLLCELMRLHKYRSVSTHDGSEKWGNFVGNMGQKYPSQNQAVPATYIPPKSLQTDLKRLLSEQIGSDFTVQVQDEIIPVHRAILIARCNYFASCLLTSGMIEARTHKLIIPAGTSMTASAFRAFLQFVYSGEVPTPKEAHTAMYLIDAASFYGLTNSRLSFYCEACVKNSFNEAHVLQLFEASSSLDVEAVRAMALDFIVSNFEKVGNQPALYALDKSLLVEILRGLAEKMSSKPASLG